MATRNYLETLLDNPNARKMLDVISQSEGTTKNGYATAFGGGLIPSLSAHPRQLHKFTQTDGKQNQTSAAGRYQFLTPTWDGLSKQLGLKDFGERSQDIAALALIAQNGALGRVLKGDFTGAIQRLGGTWASLPSSPYAQPKKSWNQVGAMLGGSGGSGGGGKMPSNDDVVNQLATLAMTHKAKQTQANDSVVDQLAALATRSKTSGQKPQFQAMDVNAEGKRVLNEKLKEAGSASLAQSGVIGTAETFGAGLLQGATFLSDGFNGVVNKALGTNLDTNNYERFTNKFEGGRKTLEQQRAANGQTGIDGARLVGNIASTLPLAVAGGVGATVASAAARGAGTGLAIGAGSFAKDAGQRATNTAFSGVGGAIGGAVGQKVTQGVVRGVNAVKGRLNPAAQEIDDLGKQYGVRTSVGDISRNPHALRTEKLLDQIPVLGTGAFRQSQQKEVAGAAAAITEKMQKNMQLAGYKQLDDIQNAAASGDRNATRIIDIINKAGSDTSKVLQAGAEVRLWREKNVARKLYDVAGNIAKTQGGAVAPTKTAQTLTSKIDEIKASLAPDDALHTDLAKIQTRLNDPNIVKDYANMRLLRSQLGSMAEKYAANGTNPNQAAAGFLGDLRSAVENDISNYAASSGNSALKNAYSRADSFYKSALKNRDSNIAKVLKSDKPDEIYTQFIQAGKGDRAANFYRNLDPKAQSALRAEMVARAVDKATKQNGGIFSPATFAGEFDRLRAPYGQIFKGADKAEMDGFVKLMRHVERAGQYTENPTNGSMVVLPAAGLGAAKLLLAEPFIGGASLSSVYGTSKLFTTAVGKKILLSANELPPGSPKLDNLLKMTQSLSTTTGTNKGRE